MFLGLFGNRSAKIAQLEVRLEAQQALIESQGQLINLQCEKIDSQLQELKSLQENIASLHETAFEQTLSKLNSYATADLVGEVKRTITADPSFASEVASDMRETVQEHLSENLDYDDLLRHIEINPSDVADNLVDNFDLHDLTERLIRQIDLDDIASRVEVDMSEFDYSETAEQIDLYDLAQEIDRSSIAEEINIDYDELNIDYSELIIDLEALVENLDYQAVSARLDLEEIASQISPNAIVDAVDLKELMSTYHYYLNTSLFGQLPSVILENTVTNKEDASGEWSDLEWSILMTVRRAIEELANELGESEANELGESEADES